MVRRLFVSLYLGNLNEQNIPSHTINQNIYLICVIKTMSSIGETFFWVYEIAGKGTGNVGWVKRDDLGESTGIFVGNNNSISVSASDFPRCQPSSIYFLENNFIFHFDMGVYNSKHQSISLDYLRQGLGTQLQFGYYLH